MPDETLPLTPPPPPGLDDILAEYVAAEEQGHAPDRQALLSRHPQFAADLREFFANRDEMQRLAARSTSGTVIIWVALPVAHSENHAGQPASLL